MTADGFDAALQALISLRPFQVFTVALKNGERFQVDFPGAIPVRSGMIVITAPGSDMVVFDHDSVSHFDVGGPGAGA